MKKRENPYRSNADYMSITQACELIGCQYPTFRRYAERFGLVGVRMGRWVFFPAAEVHSMKKMMCDDKVNILIAAIEKKTGKKVQLI